MAALTLLRADDKSESKSKNTTPPRGGKKSRWQKLKEENEQRKRNNVRYISEEEAVKRTGYDNAGIARTEERKAYDEQFAKEQKEDNRMFVGTVLSNCLVM